MITQVPIAIITMDDIDTVHTIPAIIEHWENQLTYIIVYQTPIDDGMDRIWCTEIFVGNVLSALSETIRDRMILCEPMPLTLIIISAIVVDLDDTNHQDNIRGWDGEFDPEDLPPDDDDEFLDLRDGLPTT